MIITNEAYHNLIQIQWESRKDEHTEDVERARADWYLILGKQIGEIATEINDGCPDHKLLQDIVSLADTVRSWYWTETKVKTPFIDVIQKEREFQDAKWGPQNHSRMKWYLIAAEEAGEIADAVKSKDRDSLLITEIIQLSAVLQAWVTSRDWFYPPQDPHVTKCTNCETVFETQDGDIIRCPNCNTCHYMDGRKSIEQPFLKEKP